MILNVSGRTDVVAFYTPWFINRYKEGFLDVRNPFYSKLVNRIFFDDVDLINFCTKNPLPIIPYLKDFNKLIIFQVTLTPYKKDIEPNVPDKNEIIKGIIKISEIIGKENVFIRYDPIFISEKYSVDYHIKAFKKICELLNNHVGKIIISFIDNYKNVEKNAKILKLKEIKDEDYIKIGTNFSQIAKEYNVDVQSCFTKFDLEKYGIKKEDCLGKDLAFKLTGKKFPKRNARRENFCNCVAMSDVGDYNSCTHMCTYCYANYSEDKIFENIKRHNPSSTILLGEISKDDIFKIKK